MKNGKFQRGSVYLTVMVVTSMLIMMVSVMLTITTMSRRITSRYEYFIGLYDLAVAGNEQVLQILSQGVERHRATISARASDRVIEDVITNPTTHLSFNNGQFYLESGLFFRRFREEAAPILSTELKRYYTRRVANEGIQYERNWNFAMSFTLEDGHIIEDRYSATTIVYTTDRGFSVQTRIRKYIDNILGHPATVGAAIIWQGTSGEYIFLPQFTWGQHPTHFHKP